MPQGTAYNVKSRRISDHAGGILGEWEQFQYEGHLDSRDVKYLCDTCLPRMTLEKRTVENGILQIHETVQANEVLLLHIYERD